MRKKEAKKFLLKEISPIPTSISIASFFLVLEFLNSIFYILTKGSTLPILGSGFGITLLKNFLFNVSSSTASYILILIFAPLLVFAYYFVAIIIVATIYNFVAQKLPIKGRLSA